MQGYVKFFRQMTEWEWYTDVNVFKLFTHCLLRANHTEKKWRGASIEKGSFITSYENLAVETGLTPQQVRTAINKLKSTGEITYQSTSQYSIITVNNWDKFQDDNKQNNKQITNEQQTNNKQITTNKNDKNDKNIKKEKEDFDKFFNSYPLKIDEFKTFTAFTTLLNEKYVTLDKLLESVEGYKNYLSATNQTLIKSPFNWLNERCWMTDYNELIEERKRKGPPKEKEREKKNGEYRYNPFAVL